VSSFDNEIYIDLEFMNEYKGFSLKDRKVDYEMDFKTAYDSQINLKIPDGYKVTRLPSNLTVKETNFDINITFEKPIKKSSTKSHSYSKMAASKPPKWTSGTTSIKN